MLYKLTGIVGIAASSDMYNFSCLESRASVLKLPESTGLFQTVDSSRPVSLKTPVQCQLSMLMGKDWAIFRCFFALTIVPWNKTKPLNRNVNPRAFLVRVQGYLRLLVLTRIR